MREVIICRFESAKDLKDFNKLNNTNLTPNTTDYWVGTNEVKLKSNKSNNRKQGIEYWKQHWLEMPQYISEKQEPYAKISFHFEDEDLEVASKMFNQNITDKTTSVWFPKLNAGWYSTLRLVGGSSETKYPIYVISKGRSEMCYTSKHLSQMEVKHYVVVEPNEYFKYRKNVDKRFATVLRLDMRFKKNYDTFDDLGDTKPKGPGGARNFCWEHSLHNGFDFHWVFDDNATEGFHYMNENIKIKCRTGALFKACEDFVDRYNNIAIAGLNYSKFCKMSDKTPAFVMNTRIYSFLLIRNDIPYRWRGRYNEDTDLSLRVLKDGWCTVQFNFLLAGKATTQVIKGGNTDEFYSKEGTLPKSQMLVDMHPDLAKVVFKFSRWHHHVDYSGFTQELHFKKNIKLNDTENDYGTIMINTEEVTTDDYKSYLEHKYLKSHT